MSKFAAIAAILSLAVVIGYLQQSEAEPITVGQDNASAAGRFQIIMRDGVREDTWLLDTATGGTWRETQYMDVQGQPVVWVYQQRLDSLQDLTAWAKTQQMIEPAIDDEGGKNQ